ncbi:hypothetical protein ACT7DJ_17515 [Bacillus cereus]
MNGQISHHLSYRLDDQVYYRFVKENGEIKNLEIKIDRGGWTKITAPIGAIIAQYFGVPITPGLFITNWPTIRNPNGGKMGIRFRSDCYRNWFICRIKGAYNVHHTGLLDFYHT